MKRLVRLGFGLILTIGLLSPPCTAALENSSERQLYQVALEKKISLSHFAAASEQTKFILVGEHHTSAQHHQNQLQVIQALHAAGRQVAIGMEMFGNHSQKDLDRWVAGESSEADLKKVYYRDWNYDWQLYAPILLFARNHQVPVVGLNVTREITRQVAKQGFQSLSEQQRGKLKDVACRVDRIYMDFIRRAYGGHGHGQMNFDFFCEAQLVWDNVMAINALDFLKQHPHRVMVIIAGTGHVWKPGIPAQIAKRSSLPTQVILPEIAHIIEPELVSSADADYIMLK
jgi:uncharacterized iron-regulated protein